MLPMSGNCASGSWMAPATTIQIDRLMPQSPARGADRRGGCWSWVAGKDSRTASAGTSTRWAASSPCRPRQLARPPVPVERLPCCTCAVRGVDVLQDLAVQNDQANTDANHNRKLEAQQNGRPRAPVGACARACGRRRAGRSWRAQGRPTRPRPRAAYWQALLLLLRTQQRARDVPVSRQPPVRRPRVLVQLNEKPAAVEPRAGGDGQRGDAASPGEGGHRVRQAQQAGQRGDGEDEPRSGLPVAWRCKEGKETGGAREKGTVGKRPLVAMPSCRLGSN